MKKSILVAAILLLTTLFFTACSSNGSNESTPPSNASLATLTTLAATDMTTITAKVGGNITADGGGAITARGICWSTSGNPTIAGSHTTETGTTGSFVSTITGLTLDTNYFARAYATNAAGTAYGNLVLFQTLPESTFLKFKYNNVSYNFVASTTNDVKKYIDGSQGTGIQSKVMHLYMPLNPTLGSHVISYNSSSTTIDPNSYEGHFVSQTEALYLDGTSGTITITAITSNQIEGTFSFTGINPNTSATVNITEGTFKANRN